MRAFSRAEAWLDIVAQCAYEPQIRMIKGMMVSVPRGGFVASERYLSDRWKWSRTKVRSFLKLLISIKMIEPDKNHKESLYLLLNYEKYNPQKNHKQDRGKTSEEPPEDQIEEYKEIKEGNENPYGVRDFEIPPSGIETNEEWLGRMRQLFADRDVDGEIRTLKVLAEKDGSALNRRRVEAWLRKAAPKVIVTSQKRPTYDKAITTDPPGWTQWRDVNYPDADKTIPFCRVSDTIQEEFKNSCPPNNFS